jgi:transcriptional regulator with XRE-family HTH domain
MKKSDAKRAMSAEKRKRLRRAGWRVGTAREFLGLSREEALLVDIRLALARGLRARRANGRLTQAELARSIASSQSRVAKMETGDPSVSIDLLVRALLALGASPRALARIIGSANPAVGRQVKAAEKVMKSYRNALRELAKE